MIIIFIAFSKSLVIRAAQAPSAQGVGRSGSVVILHIFTFSAVQGPAHVRGSDPVPVTTIRVRSGFTTITVRQCRVCNKLCGMSS